MKNLIQSLGIILTIWATSCYLLGDPSKILSLQGKKGPGQGKTVVLVSGDEEYRTEESMPMLAKILAEKTCQRRHALSLTLRPSKETHNYQTYFIPILLTLI